MSKSTQKYANPPIVEVVCDFRFELENPTDTTLPGLLFSEIKERYPNKKHRNMAFGSNQDPDLILSQVAQFYNQDETLLVQVGHNLLTVNCLKKYPFWEKFKPEIKSVFDKYVELAKPKKIQRISLRSINKIYLPKGTKDMTAYFEFYPNIPENIAPPLAAMNIKIESFFSGGRDILIMNCFTTFSEDETKDAYFLDLEYVMDKSGKVDLKEVENWLDTAHEELYAAFDKSITKTLKTEYKPLT